MKKNYLVFVSSVSNEFKDVRPHILETVLMQDNFFPVAMEYMTGVKSTVRTLYSYIDNSDVYMLILGKQHGSGIEMKEDLTLLCEEVPAVRDAVKRFMEEAKIEDERDITFTELEYIFADALNKEIMCFVNESSDRTAKADRFYQVIRKPKPYAAWTTVEELKSKLITYLSKFKVEFQNTQIGWIRETDSRIYQATRNAGIADATLDGKMNIDTFKNELKDTKFLKIFYTTGARFVSMNEELLKKFVANGGHIQMLCAMPNSPMLKDVQEIEELDLKSSRALIHQEFKTCMETLNNILSAAKEYNREKRSERTVGSIQCGFSSTFFRSSILICEKESAQDNWGWLTITLPPYKSKDTVSFEMVGQKGASKEDNVLISRALGHFNAVWALAKKRKEVLHVGSGIDLKEIGTDPTCNYWKCKEAIATKAMRMRARSRDVLIEIAAQHPLDESQYPNKEFKARLDTAIEIYKREVAKNKNVEFYVPGSVHLDYEGIPDLCSLSAAGCRYLIESGIPAEVVHGEDLGGRYDDRRFYKGVYNTADECFIAASYFNENQRFSKLITVCSPNQLMRKTLFYLEQEIIPHVITVPCDKLSHNFLYELLEVTPYVLNEDHSWQDEGSREAIRTRKERDPLWEE